MEIDSLPRELREALSAELDEDEPLRWAGQPVAERLYRRAWRSSGALVVMTSAMAVMCSLPSVLNGEGANKISPGGMVLLGCFSLGLVGLAVFFGFMPRWAREAARRTVYAVTCTRIIVLKLEQDGRARVESLEPGHPLLVVREELRDNCGDIMVDRRGLARQGAAGSHAGIVLEATPDSRAVEKIIRRTFDPPAPNLERAQR